MQTTESYMCLVKFDRWVTPPAPVCVCLSRHCLGHAALRARPTRRVRDAVGPSPAAARVERCVYITNLLMVRPNGSPAPATVRQRGFQLPLLIKMFCNQSCGNKQMDMLNLLLG